MGLEIYHDYMGKQFKGQTGRTIREFANELRIRWAMDRLNRTDDKIMTIAFDAGFESLRTFNRVFFRAAGMIPAEFRGEGSEQNNDYIGYSQTSAGGRTGRPGNVTL